MDRMVKGLRIIEDQLDGAEIAALLQLHLDEMHRNSPACSVHALPIEGLRADDVTFWSAWDGAELAGCGALRELAPDHGEIKSMRAAPAYRSREVGRAVLDHLIGEARARGYARLSLETGRSGAFEPAQRLYAANGFTVSVPFGSYQPDPFSLFMTRLL